MRKRFAILCVLATSALCMMILPVLASAGDNACKGANQSPGADETTAKEHGNDPGQDQGSPNNTANPDCDSNGGVDKPGQSGGYTADRDWNNGCGNDDDREDDNNGWCGHRAANERAGESTAGVAQQHRLAGDLRAGDQAAPVQVGGLSAAKSAGVRPTEVLGESLVRSGAVTVTSPSGEAGLSAKATETEVLGIGLVRGQELAVTGSKFTDLAAIGAFVIALGLGVMRYAGKRIDRPS